MAGDRTIRYNGRNISVPADFTDAEIAQVLDASDGASKPAQQPGLLQRVWDFANKPMFHTHGLPQPNPEYRGKAGEHMTLPGEDTSESTTPINAATQLLLAGQPESKLLRGGQRLLQGVLGASGGAHAVSEASEGHYGPAAIDAVGAAANTMGATKGLGREVRPLVGKVARVASDVVDPELTGVFSPRLGNAQRLLGRLADKIEKEAAPAAAGPAPMRQGPARKPLWADIPKETRPNPVAQYDQSADEASVNKLLDRKAAIADVENARANQPAKPARVPLWKQVQGPEGTPLPAEPESNIERARRRAPAPPPKSVGAAAAGFGEENPRIMSSARAEHESDQSLLAKLRDDLDAHGESAAAGVSKMGWMGNKAGYDPVLPLGPNAPAGYQTMHGPVNLEGTPIDINTGEMPSVGGGSMMDPEAARNVHLGKLRPGPMFGKPLSVVNPDFVPGGDAVPNPRSRLGSPGNGVLDEPYHPFRYEDVPLSNIRQTDGDFDPVLGADYAERWANEGPPPPIATVVESGGENPAHFLQQGHHRTTAAGMLGLPSILSRAEYPPPFDEGIKGVSMPWDWRGMATPEELEQVDRLDRLDSGSDYGTPYDNSADYDRSNFSMKRGSGGLLKRVKGST